jgi:hypothetical protein
MLHRLHVEPVHEQLQKYPVIPGHWGEGIWEGGAAACVCAALPGALLLLCGLPYP